MARTWQIDRPQLQELGGVGELVESIYVVLFGGRVDVVPQSGRGDVRLDVHEVFGRPLAVSLDDGALRVEHHKEPGSPLLGMVKGLFATGGKASARLTLTVPADAKVTINTVSAEALIGGVEGDVTVNTVSGAVSLSRLSGRVDVNTVNSSIDAAGLSGELRSKSVSGRLTVDESALRLAKLGTVSGPLILDLVGSSSVVTATTISGDITIRIPAGSGYDVSAGSQSGHVIVDGHTLSRGTEKGGHRSAGDRSLAIKARAVSGNVVVLRDASTPEPHLRADTLAPLTGTPSDVQDVRRSNMQDVRPSDPRRTPRPDARTDAGSPPGSATGTNEHGFFDAGSGI